MLAEIKKIPFVRFVVPLVLGIFCAEQLHNYRIPDFSVQLISFSFCLLAAFYFVKSYAFRWLFGISLNVFLFCSGFSFFQHKAFGIEQMNNPDTNVFVAELTEFPEEKENSYRIILSVFKRISSSSSGSKTTHQKLLVYFQKDSLVSELKPGDRIAFEAKVKEIENAKNPGAFDLKKMYFLQGISHQVYLKSTDWKHLSTRNSFHLIYFFKSVQRAVLEKYKHYDFDKDAFAVLSALTLGIKDYLTEDLRDDYSSSGAMHVLAVSGLHVGIIYLLLISLFNFAGKVLPDFLKLFLIVLSLWSFAALTGFSPSVCRSALMFSFFSMGSIYKQSYNSYNLLAASAFILLLVNPFNLFMLGFQLSYTAVLGILLLQKRIRNLFYFKNKAAAYVWELLAVSIAAQLATLPLSLYYFHQFPVFFWLTNVLVLPVIPIVMYLAIAFILSFIYAPAATVIMYPLNLGLNYINLVTDCVNSIPFSSIKNCYISDLMLVLLICMLIVFVLGVYSEKRKYFFSALSLMVLLLALNFNSTVESLKKREVVAFDAGKYICLAVNHRGSLYLITDLPEKRRDYVIGSYALTNKIKRFYEIPLESSFKNGDVCYQHSLLTYQNKSIYVLSNALLNNKTHTKRFQLDHLYIGGNHHYNLDVLLRLFSFESVFIDQSVPEYRLQKIKLSLEKSNCIIEEIKPARTLFLFE